MAGILGLGFVDLALGILVMAPLSVGYRKNETLSMTFQLCFQICLAVGAVLLILGGVMILAG